MKNVEACVHYLKAIRNALKERAGFFSEKKRIRVEIRGQTYGRGGWKYYFRLIGIWLTKTKQASSSGKTSEFYYEGPNIGQYTE